MEAGGAYFVPDPAQQARRLAEEKAETAKKGAQALRLWQDARPIGGTLAETYLRGRGILGDLPPALRYVPSCWHATAKRFPAMVALVEGGTGFAVHRTYLRHDGGGKAEVNPAKAMLGAVSGGAAVLSEAQGALVVYDGIGTGLSLLSGLLTRPATVLAALSTSGMKSLALPSAPSELVIATDSDDMGAGWLAGNALAERAAARGWAVSLWPAPEGRDWNDVLQQEGIAA